MNKQETLQVLAVIKVAYPNSFNKLTEADIATLANLWERQFKDYSYKLVSSAVDAIISTEASDFMPSIGKIKQVCLDLSSPKNLNETDAWEAVRKALKNSYYGAREEFNKLDPIIQEVVGSPETLRSWGQMDVDELENYIRTTIFNKLFKQAVESNREQKLIPSTVKEILRIELRKD